MEFLDEFLLIKTCGNGESDVDVENYISERIQIILKFIGAQEEYLWYHTSNITKKISKEINKNLPNEIKQHLFYRASEFNCENAPNKMATIFALDKCITIACIKLLEINYLQPDDFLIDKCQLSLYDIFNNIRTKFEKKVSKKINSDQKIFESLKIFYMESCNENTANDFLNTYILQLKIDKAILEKHFYLESFSSIRPSLVITANLDNDNYLKFIAEYKNLNTDKMIKFNDKYEDFFLFNSFFMQADFDKELTYFDKLNRKIDNFLRLSKSDILEVLIGITAPLIYFFDIFTDINLAFRYYKEGNPIYCQFTLGIILISFIVTTIQEIIQSKFVLFHKWKYKFSFRKNVEHLLEILKIVIQVEIVFRNIRLVQVILNLIRRRSDARTIWHIWPIYYKTVKLQICKSTELLLETIPQTILQLMIVFKSREIDWFQGISILISFISMTCTKISVQKYLTDNYIYSYWELVKEFFHDLLFFVNRLSCISFMVVTWPAVTLTWIVIRSLILSIFYFDEYKKIDTSQRKLNIIVSFFVNSVINCIELLLIRQPLMLHVMATNIENCIANIYIVIKLFEDYVWPYQKVTDNFKICLIVFFVYSTFINLFLLFIRIVINLDDIVKDYGMFKKIYLKFYVILSLYNIAVPINKIQNGI